jgi:putative glutamine amidotransferase
MLKIGLSACFFHADPERAIFKGKTLQYVEQSMAHWIMREGALVFMIPNPEQGPGVKFRDLVGEMDALVLQGGSDVSPKSYGEKALKPEWEGDYIRDQYEIALTREFMAQNKPVLGVCRGAQLLNVAFGGTLYQDIGAQVEGARNHRDWEIYDQNFHEIRIEEGSILKNLFPSQSTAKVNSIHHQAIKDLGKDLKVEARSTDDGIVEAIRYTGSPFVYAVQWHPEFHAREDRSLLDSTPILNKFMEEVRKRSK